MSIFYEIEFAKYILPYRGEEKGIKAMIATLKELNVDKKNTIDKIMGHFNLKLNVAKKYVETNW